MYEYKVVAIMGVADLLRRGRGQGKGQPANDIVEGELTDEVIGLALDAYAKKGYRLHSVVPLESGPQRFGQGYLAVFEREAQEHGKP